jgi:hypothetical protein
VRGGLAVGLEVIMPPCKSSSREAWEGEVDRIMKELVALGVEEAWPETLEDAWASQRSPEQTAREICWMLHDKYDVDYLADVLDPWQQDATLRRG